MRADFGPPMLDARMMIGAVVIKHLLNIDDREVVQQISENMYLQYFVGLSGFQKEPPFDASLLVTIRKRLGKEAVEELNEIILREAGVLNKPATKAAEKSNKKDEEGTEQAASGDDVGDTSGGKTSTSQQKPSGTLLIDATVAEQQIAYPTDLNLLNESREQLERMILKGCAVMGMAAPRMYSEIARKRYLLVAKSKRKSRTALRRGIRQQLQYLRRDLGYIDGLVEESEWFRLSLGKRDWKRLMVIHELYRQQRWMYRHEEHSIAERIVSLYQPHVRPMPRGKDRVSTEFGSKQVVMLKDGYAHVGKLDWDNFNDGIFLGQALEKYRDLYGCYPERVLGDRLYGNRENRRLMKEKGIRFVGKSLGRPSVGQKERERSLHKEMAERNPIEGKFGQGKNAYGLAKIRARLQETSESWVMTIYPVMNLIKLVQTQGSSLLATFCVLLSRTSNARRSFHGNDASQLRSCGVCHAKTLGNLSGKND
ncbi:MAG TPA: IS5 family transposase [Puia sp.]|nr:IS5 family transposase [Puia sp.]